MPDVLTGAAIGLATDAEPRPVGPRPAPAPCPNCGEPRAGRFCAECGQREMGGRLTLGGLWREFSSRVFNLDRGLLHTVASLARSPGSVPRDYVEGRRRTYTNPLGFFLMAATLSLLTYGLYEEAMIEQMTAGQEFAEGFEAGQRLAGADPRATPPAEAPSHDLGADRTDREARIDAAVADLRSDGGETVIRLVLEGMIRYNTPLTLLLALFLILPLRVLFGPVRNTAEISVFALYVVGFAVAVVALLSPLLLLILGDSAATSQAVVSLGCYIGLPAWGAVRFYPEESRVGAALRGAAAMIVAYLAFIVVSVTVGFLYLVTHVLHAAGETWGSAFRAVLG